MLVFNNRIFTILVSIVFICMMYSILIPSKQINQSSSAKNIQHLNNSNQRIQQIRNKISGEQNFHTERQSVDKDNLTLVERVLYFLFEDFFEKHFIQIQLINGGK